MLIKCLLTIVAIFLVTFRGFGQYTGAPYIQNYENGTYNGHAQVWCATQDIYGNMYFGTTTGISVYDGEEWREIKTANNSITRSLDVSSDGIIYVGGIKTFGYLNPDSAGKLQYETLEDLLDSTVSFSNVWETFCMDDKVFFRTAEALFQYTPKHNKIKYWKPNKRFNPAFHFPNKGVIVRDLNQYYLLKADSLQALPYSKLLDNYFVYKMIPKNEREFFGIASNEILVFDTESEEGDPASIYQSAASSEFKSTALYMGTRLKNRELAVGSVTEGLFLLSEDGTSYKKIDKLSGLQMNHVWNAFQDKDGLLWLTLDKGISNVNYSSPIRIWNSQIDFDESINDIIEFENRIYFSTMSGVYFLERNLKDSTFKTQKPQKLNEEIVSTWSFSEIESANNGIKSLYIATSAGPAKVMSNKLLRLADISYNYNLIQHPVHKEVLYASALNKVILIHEETNEIIDEVKMDGQSRYFAFENDSTLWVGSNYKGLYKVQLNKEGKSKSEVINYGTEKGFKVLVQLKPILINDTLFVSSTEGIYYYNRKEDRFDHYTAFNFNYDAKSIDALEVYSNKDEACLLTNSNLYHINLHSRKVDSIDYKLFTNEQLHNVYIDNFKNIWTAGPSGAFMFNRYFNDSINYMPTVTIRKVIFNNDSVLFNGTYYTQKGHLRVPVIEQPDNMKPVLPYRHNSIVFHYASPYFIKDELKEYRYILAGFDEGWSDWTKETKKEYTNLPPGTYYFSVKTRNVYGQTSEIVKYQFTIETPWFISWWAFLIYISSLVMLILLIIKRRTYALKERNRILEEQVMRRTAEINTKNEELQTQTEYLTFVNSELKKLSIAASETTNAIMIMDKNGEIEWINEGFTKLYGYNILEVKEEFGSNIIKASTNMEIEQIFKEVVVNKKSMIYQSQIPTKFGEFIDIQTNLSPILNDDNEIISIVAIDSDIRKLKKAEYELKRLNSTKDKFFSIVAHDLKNPFAALLQLSELTVNSLDKWDKDKLRFILENMHKASKEGYDLLINLLEWSRAQLGRIKIQPEVLNLKSLIQQNINLLSQQAENKNIIITNQVHERINLRTDKNSTLTVFRNIISNSIKYTPQGGKVKITATLNDRYIITQICDTGVGMKPEKIASLFSIDKDVSTPGTEDESGTGLGLILCKEFVERNGGTISVESNPGNGTVFYVELRKA
jgi:PAS domain S-box-containing protein